MATTTATPSQEPPASQSSPSQSNAQPQRLRETFIQLGASGFKNPSPTQSGFSATESSQFKLRVGPNYKKNGKKAPSEESMYDMISVDYFTCDKVYTQLGHILDIPEPKVRSIRPGIPTTILVNVALPTIKPAMMNPPTDGPCVHVVWCFQLKAQTVAMMEDWADAPSQLKLFEKWVEKAPTDSSWRGRFKMMGMVKNWDEMSLPSFLKGYNAKPILITASGSTYHNKERDYVEECANVFYWNYLARRQLDSFKSKISRMLFSFTCTIEARQDDEMPERCLFCTAHQKFYPFGDERRLTPEAYNWLRRQAVAVKRIPTV